MWATIDQEPTVIQPTDNLRQWGGDIGRKSAQELGISETLLRREPRGSQGNHAKDWHDENILHLS
jgi:hypothetical protein